jgi:serine/threonine protein kinase, bacterial
LPINIKFVSLLNNDSLLLGQLFMMRKPWLLLFPVLLVYSCGKELEFRNKPVTPVTAVIALAGSGNSGYIDGQGSIAEFYQPTGIAVDTSGNIYVADFQNNVIRKITGAGVVSTLAGNIRAGAINSVGINASFFQPSCVAVDVSGNVYVADDGNNLIREISPNGTVTTIAGSGAAGFVNGNGTTASFNAPQGIALDATGNIYVADYGNNLIRKIDAGGTVTTFAGNGNQGQADSTGTAASFYKPAALTVDALGNVYVADYGNNVIRKITPAGATTTFAGSGLTGSADGTANKASFNGITGLTADASGNLYVADYGNNCIRLISPSGAVTTLRSGSGNTGNVLVFKHPYGVALDAAGNIYVSDYGDNTIQKVTH